MYTGSRLRRGLKEQGNPTCSDLVERLTRRHVALWAGETSRPIAFHGRHDSTLVFDQGLKEIRTRHRQIPYVFSTGVGS